MLLFRKNVLSNDLLDIKLHNGKGKNKLKF